MLDFIAGVGPASERLGEWLDAHPWVGVAALLAGLLAASVV